METDEDSDHLSSNYSSGRNDSSRTNNRCLSLARRISECWNNDLWKQQRLRNDLIPISLTNHRVLDPLLKIANLTECSSSNGYSPVVLRALKQALIAHEPSSKQTRSDNRWGQEPVVKEALQSIRNKCQTD